MFIYTLKLAVRGPSPMVWRRLRIPGDTSIAELHRIFQISMGWDDEYLHCFHIHGKDYGISYEGGTLYSDDAHTVQLADFAFDVGDKFTYTYNFFAQWLCDVRVEAIESAMAFPHSMPVCLSGHLRHGISDYDRLVASEKAIRAISTFGKSTTIGTVRRALEDYEATRFNRQSVNRALASTRINLS